MDQAEQVNNQVLDLEDMQFKADDLNAFTSKASKDDSSHQQPKINKQ